MNKRIKSIIATVLVLGAFSLNYLHAEEVKVNESKLTNLSYFKKTYKTKDTYKCVDEDGFYYYYYSSDRKAVFVKVKRPKVKANAKIGMVNVDNEVYGRVVIHVPGVTFTCNLHDTEYSFKGKLAANFTKEDAEDLVKEFKDCAIELTKTN